MNSKESERISANLDHIKAHQEERTYVKDSENEDWRM